MGCNKIGFETREEILADHRLSSKIYTGAKSNKLKPYFCNRCKMWHMTSLPNKTTRSRDTATKLKGTGAATPLGGMRGYQKKRIFNQVREIISESGYRDKRLIFNEIKRVHFKDEMTERFKSAYFYVINKQLKGLR